tara:strand:+ start:586 stop:702 length:117 start_codon:yes stop_codon:yes gene_type:complete
MNGTIKRTCLVALKGAKRAMKTEIPRTYADIMNEEDLK